MQELREVENAEKLKKKNYISFKIGIFTHKIEAGSGFIKKNN
jgi:hypothetical protein